MKASCCYSSCWKFQPFRFPFHLFTDIHHHISYDMYLSSHTRGIPKKSGPSDQFQTYSGPLLALRSGSGPSPEFRTFLVPLLKGSLAIFFSIDRVTFKSAFEAGVSARKSGEFVKSATKITSEKKPTVRVVKTPMKPSNCPPGPQLITQHQITKVS